MLTAQGKLKCIDFGTCDVQHIPDKNDELYHDFLGIQKRFNSKPKISSLPNQPVDNSSRKSFVGTTYYIAPEMITDQNSVDPAVDLWAFGVILYRLCTGKYLFDETNDYLTFEKIKKMEFQLDEKLGPDTLDFVKRLLASDPKERMGYGGFQEMKAHPFFKEIDWDNIDKMESPLKGWNIFRFLIIYRYSYIYIILYYII